MFHVFKHIAWNLRTRPVLPKRKVEIEKPRVGPFRPVTLGNNTDSDLVSLEYCIMQMITLHLLQVIKQGSLSSVLEYCGSYRK